MRCLAPRGVFAASSLLVATSFVVHKSIPFDNIGLGSSSGHIMRRDELPRKSKSAKSAPTEELAAPLLVEGTKPAKVQKDSVLMLTFWFLFLVVCKILWGLYLVDLRYMQVVMVPPLPALRLTFYIAWLSLVGTLVLYTLPVAAYKALTGTGKPAEQKIIEEPAVSAQRLRASRWELAKAGVVMSASVGALTLCQVWCTAFTSPSFAQLVFMTSPIFVALVASGALGAPIPHRLFPTLAVTLIGAGLVLYGGIETVGGYKVTSRDAIGLSLAFISVLGQAVYYTWIQKTRALMSTEAPMYIENGTLCIAIPLLSYFFEADNWSQMRDWRGVEWGTLLFAAVLVHCIGAIMQNMIIRHLGATMFAMGNSARLVAAIIGSWVLLDEKVQGPYEWSGIALVVAAITYYLYIQYRQSQGPGPQQLAEAAAAEKLLAGADISKAETAELETEALELEKLVSAQQVAVGDVEAGR